MLILQKPDSQPKKPAGFFSKMCSCFRTLNEKNYFTLNGKKETVLDILESLYLNYDKDIAYLLWDAKIRHY